MRLVAGIVKRYSCQGEHFFEQLSAGNMSLIRALARKPDLRGPPFLS